MIDSSSNLTDNMVNLYNSRLKEFRLAEKIEETRQKLDQWRAECHRTIDELYQRKLEELNAHLDQFRKEHEEKRTKIQTNIARLTGEENAEQKKSMIQEIEQNLNEIEQTTLQIRLRSLTMNESYIQIEKPFHLSNLKQETTPTFLYSQDSSSAIASNERFLLMHQSPYLNLIDQDLKISKQVRWTHDWIRDMCWSTTLQSFILITLNKIHFVSENLQLYVSTKEDPQQTWFSSTCSKDFLYVSTCQWGSKIFQFSLTSPIDFIKQWQPPFTCADYEGINDIKCNEQTLAIMIKDSKEHKNEWT